MGVRGRRTACGLAAVGLVELALIGLGRIAGSTRAERGAALPGDDVVPSAGTVTDHAVTIDAPPAAVWPWLVQMGWHRGGWYTARWVDRLLFPANLPSATAIQPELQHLQVGDFVPDGAPETGCGLYVDALVPERSLVLHSNSHLPTSWRRRGIAELDWSWAFVLQPVDGGRRTRFHFRSRWRTAPWWLTLGGWLVVVPADLVMSRSMLRGIRSRAEGRTLRHDEGAVRLFPPGPVVAEARSIGGEAMTDFSKIENAAAGKEAAEAAGRPHARSSRTGDIEAGLMRYLAAEQYHEKVEETREEKKKSAEKPEDTTR